jgi:hypothetical protein
MTIDSIGSDDSFVDWDQNAGSWDGRSVTWEPSSKSWLTEVLETIGNQIIYPRDYSPYEPMKEVSTRFTTEGRRRAGFQIGGINGMNVSLEEAKGHAEYLKGFTPELAIDWVHNCSHTSLIDALEIPLNYLGCSPNTVELLQKNWGEFHDENRDRPHARYLQFCHSQGAIHTLNAIAATPEEIRARLMIVAIAPADVIPREVCYSVQNIGSKKDVVPNGRLAFLSFFDPGEVGNSKLVEMALENRQQLVSLPVHPEVGWGLDHGFQSPTFEERIRSIIEEYLQG